MEMESENVAIYPISFGQYLNTSWTLLWRTLKSMVSMWCGVLKYWRKNGCCPVAGWYSISSEYPGFERWCMIFCIRFWKFGWQWWLPNTDGTLGAWRIYDGFKTDMHVIFKVCFSLLFNDRWWDAAPDAPCIVTFHSCCCLQNLCLCSRSCICFFMFQCFQICLKSGLFQFQLGLLFF